MPKFCNIIRIWYICQCLNKMRAEFGISCETDYISCISAWEKLLNFKMFKFTEKQEISWGISASRNLIAQLKNNWSVSRCSMKSALINLVKTSQGHNVNNKNKILRRKFTLKTQFVCFEHIKQQKRWLSNMTAMHFLSPWVLTPYHEISFSKLFFSAGITMQRGVLCGYWKGAVHFWETETLTLRSIIKLWLQ